MPLRLNPQVLVLKEAIEAEPLAEVQGAHNLAVGNSSPSSTTTLHKNSDARVFDQEYVQIEHSRRVSGLQRQPLPKSPIGQHFAMTSERRGHGSHQGLRKLSRDHQMASASPTTDHLRHPATRLVDVRSFLHERQTWLGVGGCVSKPPLL